MTTIKKTIQRDAVTFVAPHFVVRVTCGE
jgi:hypothetical protein